MKVLLKDPKMKSSGGKQKSVTALGELAKLTRFCITFPTKYTNKNQNLRDLNMELYMRLLFEN